MENNFNGRIGLIVEAGLCFIGIILFGFYSNVQDILGKSPPYQFGFLFVLWGIAVFAALRFKATLPVMFILLFLIVGSGLVGLASMNCSRCISTRFVLQRALEEYRSEHDSYPESLSLLPQQYAGYARRYDYSPTEDTYQLCRDVHEYFYGITLDAGKKQCVGPLWEN